MGSSVSKCQLCVDLDDSVGDSESYQHGTDRWLGGNLPDRRKHSSSFRTALALFPPKSRPMAKADERSLIKNQQKRGSSRLEPKEIVHIKVPMANRPRAGTKEMTGPVVITSRGINERAPDNDINCLQEFKKMMTKEGFHICKGTLDTGQTQSRISFRRRRQRMLKIDLDQGILFWNSFDPKKINTDLNKIPLTSIIEIAQGPFPSSRIPEREGRCHVGIKSLDPKIEIVFQGASMEKTDFFVDGLALLCAEEKKSRTSFTSEMKSAI